MPQSQDSIVKMVLLQYRQDPRFKQFVDNAIQQAMMARPNMANTLEEWLEIQVSPTRTMAKALLDHWTDQENVPPR